MKGIAAFITIAAMTLLLATSAQACERVKIKGTIEFCDIWFYQTINPSADIDFRRGDSIYVTNDSGRVIGFGLVKMSFPYVGALIHVFGDEPMTPRKDGPTNGDILRLRWSRLPGCGDLPTEDVIRYRHWESIRVYPILPVGD